jgi:N-acetylmuramic acid 6-phosphate etherase
VEADFAKIKSAASEVWPKVPCYATNDLETALTAANHAGGSERLAKVLIVSGTGSGCYGKTAGGRGVKVGGWGHLLGDGGSGYDIGLGALRGVIAAFDRQGPWPALGARILRALALNQPTDLIDWAQTASKAEIAGLALEVFQARAKRDTMAVCLLKTAAGILAEDGLACAHKIAEPGVRIQFVLTGSVLLKQPWFRAQVARELRQRRPGAVVTPLGRDSVWGAVALAARALKAAVPSAADAESISRGSKPRAGTEVGPTSPAATVRSAERSPTEQRHPGSLNLDKLSVKAAIELMLSEDATIPDKLRLEAGRIEQVVRTIARAFRRGGRLFYFGAGTSGRLGVLDASECPPTFRSPEDLVQGVIAGGQSALWGSVETAEDDALAGEQAVIGRGIKARDVVIGIAASGTTPFVWGALRAAKQRGATTGLVCFNPYLTIPKALRPNLVIAPNLGPELLTGSTRLKAGTATKLLLNMFTTLAMVRLGKVRSNLMIDLNPSNTKLQDRAVRIVQDLTGTDYASAQTELERAHWVIKTAVARLSRKSKRQPGSTSRSGTTRS